MHVGQEVEIVLDAISEETLKGEIAFISYTPRAGEVGSIYKVRVVFADDELELGKYRIGLSGDARFVLRKKEDTLYVPPSFVGVEDGKYYVHTTDKNGRVYIDVGLEGEDRTEIAGGDIKEGDTVYD